MIIFLHDGELTEIALEAGTNSITTTGGVSAKTDYIGTVNSVAKT